MTDIAGGLKALSEGLFKVGGVVINRENDEIAFMRQKALQELGIQAQKDLQSGNQEFLKGQQQSSQEFQSASQATDIAARRGETVLSQEFTKGQNAEERTFRSGLEKQRQGFESSLAKLKSAEEARQRTEYSIAAINKDIETMWSDRQKAEDAGAPPESLAKYDARMEALQNQAEVVRAAGIAAERRISGVQPVAYPGAKPQAPAQPASAAAPGVAPTAPAAPAASPRGWQPSGPGGTVSGSSFAGAAEPLYVPPGSGTSFGAGQHSSPGASDPNQDLFYKRPPLMYPGR